MSKIVTDRPAFQGDVMLRRVEALPSGVEPVAAENGAYIVTHSETGHNHIVAERPTVTMYRLPESIYEAFIVVEGEPATVEHQRSFDTHAPLTLPPGVYQIKRQREYTPEGYRRAAD